MSKITNLFKSPEYEALFRFAYAPNEFVKIEYFNFNEFKNKTIKSVCEDVINDFFKAWENEDASLKELRFSRYPVISFKDCFKSEEHMVVFFLLFADSFSCATHGCGDFKKDILGIREDVEDITENAVKWKRNMFSLIDELEDLSEEQKVFAKTATIEFWNNMNISEAPETDLQDLAYIM